MNMYHPKAQFGQALLSHYYRICESSMIQAGWDCTAPLNLRTDGFSFVIILFVKNSVASEAQLLKGHPGALARDSVERASAVLRCDGL
jgi:hypothetical protein